MSADANTLFEESKCFLCFGVSEAEAIELALLTRIANSQSSGDNERITDAGDIRITDAGDTRIWS